MSVTAIRQAVQQEPREPFRLFSRRSTMSHAELLRRLRAVDSLDVRAGDGAVAA